LDLSLAIHRIVGIIFLDGKDFLDFGVNEKYQSTSGTNVCVDNNVNKSINARLYLYGIYYCFRITRIRFKGNRYTIFCKHTLLISLGVYSEIV